MKAIDCSIYAQFVDLVKSLSVLVNTSNACSCDAPGSRTVPALFILNPSLPSLVIFARSIPQVLVKDR